jgi:hypothetical protein
MGTDTLNPSNSYGVIGSFPTYNLKQIGVGIDTTRYLNAAYAVNASSTIALVNQMFPGALWEVTCFNPVSDCTYSYGDRTWSYGADTWARARESLLQIAVNAPTFTPSNIIEGTCTFKGKFTFQ